jgi:hypothetical protein
MDEPKDFKASANILIARCQAEIMHLTEKIAVENELADELFKRYETTKRSIECFKSRRDVFLKNISHLQVLRDKDPDNINSSGKVDG